MHLIAGKYGIIIYHTISYTHFQSGLTALRMAQSEGGHQDVCNILVRHGGSKVISPEQEVSEVRSED